MGTSPFFAVTVDQIPEYAKGTPILEMTAGWIVGHSSNEVFDELQADAKKNGYDGIVGLRFQAVYDTNHFDKQHIQLIWIAYGTFVKFARA